MSGYHAGGSPHASPISPAISPGLASLSSRRGADGDPIHARVHSNFKQRWASARRWVALGMLGTDTDLFLVVVMTTRHHLHLIMPGWMQAEPTTAAANRDDEALATVLSASGRSVSWPSRAPSASLRPTCCVGATRRRTRRRRFPSTVLRVGCATMVWSGKTLASIVWNTPS